MQYELMGSQAETLQDGGADLIGLLLPEDDEVQRDENELCGAALAVQYQRGRQQRAMHALGDIMLCAAPGACIDTNRRSNGSPGEPDAAAKFGMAQTWV